ncbi:MAG: DNA-formamidopyrimidine glycosylase [Chloroflexi bacterium]|nr:DNA-formamidopyrimidine glycosylase [Chloroflexota bacterium]
MPELPEVETIKEGLRPRLAGQRITAVEVLRAGAVKAPHAEDFCRGLAGNRILRVERRGKYLLFPLEDGRYLIVHLRMTGVLIWDGGDVPYVSVRFYLEGGHRLVFQDRRRLGALWLVADTNTVVGGLGPEPLGPEFTLEAFRERLRKRSAPVKALLLDQHFLAGLGNMYADEALFQARVHPLKKAQALSQAGTAGLHRAIKEVLSRGIALKGASVDTYRLPDGGKGGAHLVFQVAHRRGLPCPVCSTLIQRISLRGRGAYFCPSCQGLP